MIILYSYLFSFFLINYPLNFFFFFFNDTATTEIYTLSLHDALPIYETESTQQGDGLKSPEILEVVHFQRSPSHDDRDARSEEHTSELQSPCNLVCRLLLEKKKKKIIRHY